MPYLFHVFPFCTCRTTESPHQCLNHRAVLAAFGENQDFLQRKQNRTNAHEPRASPLLRGSNITNTEVTYRQVQSSNSEHELRKQSGCTILPRAQQPRQDHGPAGERSHKPHLTARASPSPPRRVCAERRVSQSHHPGQNSGTELS